MSDILEELDALLVARVRWLEDWQMKPPASLDDLLRRARDEIAALRKIALWDKQVHNEALEEAASAAGAAIRGLKR